MVVMFLFSCLIFLSLQFLKRVQREKSKRGKRDKEEAGLRNPLQPSRGNGERFFRYISSFSLYFLPLYPFPISKFVTFCRKMLNTNETPHTGMVKCLQRMLQVRRLRPVQTVPAVLKVATRGKRPCQSKEHKH